MTTSDTYVCRQIVPFDTFKKLRCLWQQVAELNDFQALLLTEAILSTEIHPSEIAHERECFSILLSPELYALLVGIPTNAGAFYEVNISFDAPTIRDFLSQRRQSYPEWIEELGMLNSLTTPTNLQSYLLLEIMKILIPAEQEDSNADYPKVSVCQPVEDALFQQIEQERLLNQVISQIRQSLELPVVLETAVREVRNFLKVDRLLIYQFLNESSPSRSPHGKGQITYEARISEAIPSILNLEAEDDCFSYIPHYEEKYRRGLIVAVEDVDKAYSSSFCLAEFLRQYEVRSKLIAPIVVQDELWGLLIAHQCHQRRQWQESERKFLGHIGEHLAIAIYQAQLYTQVHHQKNLFEQRVIERTQELQDTLIAAEAANLLKSEFLNNISHELLSPLTCIIGLSSTLQRSASIPKFLSPEKQKQYLKTIEDNGHKLQDLINDLLNFSQLSAGRAILDIKEFSLNELCDDAIKSVENIAEEEQIKLELELRFDEPEKIFCADRKRVKQILLHLLKNAIKFTPENGMVILRVWRESNQVVFQIEDTGIGIAEQQISLLFETFRQLETSRKRTFGGIGLGLALTKQLIELHQGTIEVESALKKGSLFTVRLPDRYYPQVDPSRHSNQNHQLERQVKTIVLVEKDEEIANNICEFLTLAGYQFVWLIDFSSSKKIEIIQPDIVILDRQLPNVYHLSKTLKHSIKTSSIKILLLQDTPAAYDEKLLDKNGIDDYLTKPVRQNFLLEKIKYLLSLPVCREQLPGNDTNL